MEESLMPSTVKYREANDRFYGNCCFYSTILLVLLTMSGCSPDAGTAQSDSTPVAVAQDSQRQDPGPVLTENIEMLPKIDKKTLSGQQTVTPSTLTQGDAAVIAPLEERAKLEYINASNYELREKVKNLEAQLEHMDAISVEKSQAIEAVSKQLLE